MSKAILDISSLKTSSDVRSALMFAGVESDEDSSEELLAIFRSTDVIESESLSEQEKSRIVGIWTGTRSDRNHNPFQAGVYHVIGAWPRLDPELVRSTVEHLETRAFIQLEELLAGDAIQKRFTAKHSKDKATLLKALDGFCTEHGVRDHVTDNLAECLEELYTNALYNAPIENGKHTNAELARTVEVTSPKPIEVILAADDTNVALAVTDNFGSLKPKIIIDNLSRCYSNTVATVSRKAGGAGLGFFILLQNATRLVVNIDPGKRTQVIVVRHKNESRRTFSRGAPTINICQP